MPFYYENKNEIRIVSAEAALWNRNRRNRNFLSSGTGTGTVTVIKYGSETGPRFQIMYLIFFI
jgi:hypothetical protein